MTDMTLTGRCLCGAVRYECAGPVSAPTLCHCESCRRASGAPAVAWVTVRLSQLRFTHGAPHPFASSLPVMRTFCAGCGSSLTYRHEDYGDTIDVTVATLDDPSLVKPADHIWMNDAISWDRPGDGLPQHAKLRRPE
jgi:hypothetical protein